MTLPRLDREHAAKAWLAKHHLATAEFVESTDNGFRIKTKYAEWFIPWSMETTAAWRRLALARKAQLAGVKE